MLEELIVRVEASYPNSEERILHIFKHQVYGLAPTECIYRIAPRYILLALMKTSISQRLTIICDKLIVYQLLKLEH